jgi:hypothetical protein
VLAHITCAGVTNGVERPVGRAALGRSPAQ